MNIYYEYDIFMMWLMFLGLENIFFCFYRWQLQCMFCWQLDFLAYCLDKLN